MIGRLPSIRFQMVAATLGVAFVVALLLLPLARERVAHGFDAFEAAHVEQEQRRLQNALQETAAALARTAIDYSRWADTVEYMAGTRPEWLEDNLTDDVFETFGVASIVMADTDLRVVSVRAAPDTTYEDGAAASLARAGTCKAAIARREPAHRFEMDGALAQVVVCSPIMLPDELDVVGVMLWTVTLDDTRLDAVSRLTQFPFALQAAGSDAAVTVRFDEDTFDAHLPIHDSDGRASILATMRLPRPLGAQRELTTHVLLLLVAAALALPPLLMLVLLEANVVRRLRGMSTWVRSLRLREREPLQAGMAPPPSPGFAELAMLTQEFADLASRLETSRSEWRQEALRDSLTGLGNRPRLLADLATLLDANVRPVTVWLVDLDGFKAVNDLLGHPAGDALLLDVARTLRTSADADMQLYRLGGDEFAVVGQPDDAAAPARIARTLVDALRFVRHAAERPLSITACVGAASAPAAESTGVSELLAHADLALYEAKRAGRGSLRLFSPAMHAQYRDTLALEGGLREALAQARLEAWFQPIVDARSGAVVAVEALARWHDAAQGWIPPSRFITLAEHTGQIVEVDLAVFGAAIRAFAPMRVRHPRLQLHVNVSACTLADDDFMPRLDALLAACDLPRDALCVELTESDLSVGPEHLQQALTRLRLRGLQLVVDDFGVGASSLGRLVQVRPVAVKIDGSFVRELHGDGGRICRAIVELARELGMVSVAEFVETEAHAATLLAMGCDALQGYGVSPPLAPAAMIDWLDARAARGPDTKD